MHLLNDAHDFSGGSLAGRSTGATEGQSAPLGVALIGFGRHHNLAIRLLLQALNDCSLFYNNVPNECVSHSEFKYKQLKGLVLNCCCRCRCCWITPRPYSSFRAWNVSLRVLLLLLLFLPLPLLLLL